MAAGQALICFLHNAMMKMLSWKYPAPACCLIALLPVAAQLGLGWPHLAQPPCINITIINIIIIIISSVRSSNSHPNLLVTQHHQVPTSTALYWPSTTNYQPVPPFTDPVPLSINHYRPLLTQCHQIQTSSALYWPSINQYRPLLTQHHQVPTSTALYWPSTIKYQPVPSFTDPVLSSTNQYCPILSQYYWPSNTKYQLVSAHVDPYLKTIFGDLEWFGDVLG